MPARHSTRSRQRGQLICGVNTGLAGFAAADSQGNWSGLDVDVCKALAAAMLGDARKVKYVPLNAQQRFTACSPARSTCCRATPPGR
jgi:general L-amino acid transport system substrate-binding protein